MVVVRCGGGVVWWWCGVVVVAIIILVIPMQHCGNMYGITLNSLETYDGGGVVVVIFR